MQMADSTLDRRADEEDKGGLEALIRTRTRGLSEFSTYLQTFCEREKSDLARKLHDELGGLLTAAKMDLSWMQSRLEAGSALHERLAQLGSVLDEAMDLKRRVVEELRPSLLDHFGLPTAVRAYVETTCAKAGLKSEIRIAEACESLSKDAAIALFRVVQEGLSNIIRHAQATVVRLELAGGRDRCTVTLGDDGSGFDALAAQPRSTHGIMGMQLRVQALGGRMDVESHASRGTILRVEVPARYVE
jgi:signal transduction histidine kinase